MPAPSFAIEPRGMHATPLVPSEKTDFISYRRLGGRAVANKQAGVVFLGCGGGGGTRLGLQPGSSRPGNAGNAGQVEEEGCAQRISHLGMWFVGSLGSFPAANFKAVCVGTSISLGLEAPHKESYFSKGRIVICDQFSLIWLDERWLSTRNKALLEVFSCFQHPRLLGGSPAWMPSSVLSACRSESVGEGVTQPSIRSLLL